jgi:hypothetical protein
VGRRRKSWRGRKRDSPKFLSRVEKRENINSRTIFPYQFISEINQIYS